MSLLQLFSAAFIMLTAYLIISPEKISLKKVNEANLGRRLHFRCLLSILQSKAPLSISVPTVQIHQRDGMGREEGSGWGTHVYLWRIHFDVWQNQYNIVKFKKNK